MGLQADRAKYLVCHDYGMGGLWWWVIANSAEEIRQRIAEVTVVTDPALIAKADSWDPQLVDLDGPPDDPALQSLMATRSRQQDQPGFGRWAGRRQLFVRMAPIDGEDWYFELDHDGFRVRQVSVSDGVLRRAERGDWSMDTPFDLYDPEFPAEEISQTDFEELWASATPESD